MRKSRRISNGQSSWERLLFNLPWQLQRSLSVQLLSLVLRYSLSISLSFFYFLFFYFLILWILSLWPCLWILISILCKPLCGSDLALKISMFLSSEKHFFCFLFGDLILGIWYHRVITSISLKIAPILPFFFPFGW